MSLKNVRDPIWASPNSNWIALTALASIIRVCATEDVQFVALDVNLQHVDPGNALLLAECVDGAEPDLLRREPPRGQVGGAGVGLGVDGGLLRADVVVIEGHGRLAVAETAVDVYDVRPVRCGCPERFVDCSGRLKAVDPGVVAENLGRTE